MGRSVASPTSRNEGSWRSILNGLEEEELKVF